MAKAILPRNPADPVGSDRAERRAIADFQRRMRQVLRLYRDAVKATPAQAVTVNAVRYEFDLRPEVLAALTAEIEAAVDRILLEGGIDNLWFMVGYVLPAYQAGTAAAWRNLGAQTERYALARPVLQSVLQSEPYRLRIGYLAAREFENMRGLSEGVKASMGRILTDGFSQGLNPLAIARSLTAQAGIEQRRAERIARTEIGHALRQARLDESQQAAAEFGIESRMMWFSALSPTTRPHHAARHGELYGPQDVREFYTVSGNAINCYLPGTRVAGRFVAGSKARYQGPTVRLVTAGGPDLTVTPNHPVLTLAGLIPAAELRKGDYLLAYRAQVEDPAGVVELNGQLVNPEIEQVLRALADLGHSGRAGVRAVDFHGDARNMDEHVEIVRADRELPCAVDPALAQVLDELQLIHIDPVGGPAERSRRLGQLRIDLAAAGSMGGGHVSGALLSRHFLIAHDSALGSPSDREPHGAEPAGQSDPAITQSLLDFLQRHAGQVQLVQLVDKIDGEFSGHVYDLEEASGLMVANGIIASNCKCSQIEVLVDSRGEPLDPTLVARVKAMRTSPAPG